MYILCELDGAVLDRPMATFQLVPYFAHKCLELPQWVLDADEKRLGQMAQSSSNRDNDESDNKDVGELPADEEEEDKSSGEEDDKENEVSNQDDDE